MPPAIPHDALWIVDGHSQIFRAFFAIKSLSTSRGLPTNAIFGFSLFLRSLRDLYKPKYLTVALDNASPTFRNTLFPAYKANRSETPPEFIAQMPYIERLLKALRIPILDQEGFEADDMIATVAEAGRTRGFPVVVVSSDKDLFQLVGDNVLFCRLVPDNKEAEWFDAAAVEAKMGVPPSKMVDYQALVGDSTDNIPGVPGIGPKTAVELLKSVESLDALLATTASITKKRSRELLEQYADQARMSRELARLSTKGVLPDVLPQAFAWPGPDAELLGPLFQELEFRNQLPGWMGTTPAVAEPPVPKAPRGESGPQGDIFGGDDGATSDDAEKQSSVVVAGDLAPIGTIPTIVRTMDELKSMCAAIDCAGHVAIDSETTGIGPLVSSLVGISACVEEGSGYYVPIGHTIDSGEQLSIDAVRATLGPLLASDKITKSGHNAKYDLEVLANAGLPVGALKHDTMIAGQLLFTDHSSVGLKTLAAQMLKVAMTPIAELIGTGRHALSMDKVPVAKAAPYAAADADATLRLERYIVPEVERANLTSVYRNIEMPLLPVLVAMEIQGVALDMNWLNDLSNRFRERLEEVKSAIFAEVGFSFNLNSPKQVADVLFTKLGLPTQKKTKTGQSTDVTVLETLAPLHVVAKHMLTFRQFEKLLSTYVDPLPSLRHPKTGRVHCSYNQIGASTGRMSCNDPNLQNIPIRTEEGREIRRGFVASAPDRVLLTADYSQIELRLLAHVSQDPALMDAYRTERDIHRVTAARMFAVPEESVTKDQRNAAKTINFGIIYGMGPFRLAQELQIDQAQAKKFIADYFAGYPGVRRWLDQTVIDARENGFVSTLSGRTRKMDDITSSNAVKRQAAERVSTNTPLQGSAADLIKLAMIKLHGRLTNELPECKLILQVHDELVVDCPKDQVDAAHAVVKQSMETAMHLSVPLNVEIGTGRSWAESKE